MSTLEKLFVYNPDLRSVYKRMVTNLNEIKRIEENKKSAAEAADDTISHDINITRLQKIVNDQVLCLNWESEKLGLGRPFKYIM